MYMLGALLRLFIMAAILALGGLFLFWSGLLPQALYPAIYQVVDNWPINLQTTLPYYEQFEGHWTFTLASNIPTSAYRDCPNFSVIIFSHNAHFIGRAFEPGYILGIEASSTVSGNLIGMFYSGNRSYQGMLQGSIAHGTGSGAWQDNQDCYGTWKLEKISPVVDPAVGRITSVKGRAVIVRGTHEDDAWPTDPVYAGDVVKPFSGAIVVLELNGRALTLSSPYIVPETAGQ